MRTALYRRYRPESFQEVIGQEHVTVPLMAALEGDRTNHAYLFSGPRGCGKTTSARILARCLNCAEGPTATPCGTCDSCVDLSRGGSGSLDVVELDAASHGGVEDARDLRERASFAPARDRFKVFIIDEAHMVSNQGFNALLKLVEEPPEHVKFVFATTEPEKVIGTIRSRTHHYPFRLVPPDTLEQYLEQICADENVEPGQGVLPLVVRAGTGSVRDTLSVLDQLIGGASDNTLDYHACVSLLGYTDGALLDETIDAIAARDGAGLYATVDRLVQSGHDPRRFAEDLLTRLRDIVILSLAGESARDVLASMPLDQLERMQDQADNLGAARSSRAADLVNEALSTMVGATSPRLQLELLCARLLVDAAPETGAAVASPVADPRAAARSFGRKKQEPAKKEPAEKPQPAPEKPADTPAPMEAVVPEPETDTEPEQSTPPQPVVPPQESQPVVPVENAEDHDTSEEPQVDKVDALRRAWRQIMAEVRDTNMRTREILNNATIGGVTDDGVTWAFQDQGLLSEFYEGDHGTIFATIASNIVGFNVNVFTDPQRPQPRVRENNDDQEGDLPVAPEAPLVDEPTPSETGNGPEVIDDADSVADPDLVDPVDTSGDSVIPDFAAVDLPPLPPVDLPDMSAVETTMAQSRNFSSLSERHAGGPVVEEEELDVETEETLVSEDDPLAIDADGIGLNVIIEKLNGTVIEEIEDTEE